MAYLEVRQHGKLVKQRYIDADKARRGFRIRIGPLGKVFVKLGDSATLGDYEIQVLEEPLSNDTPDAKKQQFPTISQDMASVSRHPSAVGSGATHPQIEGYTILGQLGEGAWELYGGPFS